MNVQPTDLRVLHVVSSTDRRGAETAALALARALEDKGCEGDVVALAPGEGDRLQLDTLGERRFSFPSLRALSRMVARADVAVAHGSSTLPAVAATSWRSSTPWVYRSIGDPAAWVTTPARRARVRLAARRSAAVVALWRGAAVTWHERLGIPADRIYVIPNGTDITQFRIPTPRERLDARRRLQLPESGPLILALGALSKEKRLDRAMRAISGLPDLNLAIVGDGPERVNLESLAASLDSARIHLLGPTDQPWLVLQAADILMVPSDTEGQPAAAIEAGLTGLPVVASRVGGMDEVVIHGRTGVLVPAGDLEGLASGVSQCLARRDEMGLAARQHCEASFAIEPLASLWYALFRRIAKLGPREEQRTIT